MPDPFLPAVPTIRQVVICARDYDQAVGDLCAAFGTYVCHRDPGLKFFGLQNGLMPLGKSFFEIVSPIEKGVTADRFLDRHGEAAGYMLEVQGGLRVVAVQELRL